MENESETSSKEDQVDQWSHLKPGDKVIRLNRNDVRVIEVERLTKTQIVTAHEKWSRRRDGSLVGGGEWNAVNIKLIDDPYALIALSKSRANNRRRNVAAKVKEFNDDQINELWPAFLAVYNQ